MAMTKCKECKKDISDSADICPHCGIKNPNITAGTKVISFILVIIIIIFFFSKCSDDNEVQTQTTNLISFKIIEKKDQSYAGMSRMTYRVLLDVLEEPNKQNIKDVALAVWSDGNKSWKEFTIFFYLPEMDTHSVAYGIANFTPDGIENFNVTEKTKIALTDNTLAVTNKTNRNDIVGQWRSVLKNPAHENTVSNRYMRHTFFEDGTLVVENKENSSENKEWEFKDGIFIVKYSYKTSRFTSHYKLIGTDELLKIKFKSIVRGEPLANYNPKDKYVRQGSSTEKRMNVLDIFTEVKKLPDL